MKPRECLELALRLVEKDTHEEFHTNFHYLGQGCLDKDIIFRPKQ